MPVVAFNAYGKCPTCKHDTSCVFPINAQVTGRKTNLRFFEDAKRTAQEEVDKLEKEKKKKPDTDEQKLIEARQKLKEPARSLVSSGDRKNFSPRRCGVTATFTMTRTPQTVHRVTRQERNQSRLAAAHVGYSPLRSPRRKCAARVSKHIPYGAISARRSYISTR